MSDTLRVIWGCFARQLCSVDRLTTDSQQVRTVRMMCEILMTIVRIVSAAAVYPASPAAGIAMLHWLPNLANTRADARALTVHTHSAIQFRLLWIIA